MALKFRFKETRRTFLCFEDGYMIPTAVTDVPTVEKLVVFNLDGFLSLELSSKAVSSVLHGSFSDDRKERYFEGVISSLAHEHAKDAVASEVDTVAFKAEFEVMTDIFEPSETLDVDETEEESSGEMCGVSCGFCNIDDGEMLWSARKGRILEGPVVDPLIIAAQSIKLAREGINLSTPWHWGSCGSHSSTPTKTLMVHWVPPPQDVLKVNFDGSFKQGSGGAGFIVRDHMGEVLYAGCRTFPAESVPQVELRAAWEALRVTVQCLHGRRVILEGDSEIIISWITHTSSYTQRSWPLVNEIKQMADSLEFFKPIHVFREGNVPADWLAGQHCAEDYGHVSSLPPQLAALVRRDSVGFPYRRPCK
uniref:Uncharacterized protein LOC114914796 n=1 Tax=Elaeis guineensis var. tenera TaxID=51953 RepID=A0A8N4F421_ELAGV|nr:uncharacterized protein LOC114914796 [Elaeis guineensis]